MRGPGRRNGFASISGATPGYLESILLVGQYPAGPTVHFLEGLKGTAWVVLGSFRGSTTDGDVLTWLGSADVSAFRVTTTQSPSWVAWRDIQFYR
jgi:hypothetical protein